MDHTSAIYLPRLDRAIKTVALLLESAPVDVY